MQSYLNGFYPGDPELHPLDPADPADADTSVDDVDVLKAAGHTATYLPRQPGMVCRIDSLPDPCNGAPVTAYWSYWQASPGGSWSYSTVGAASTHPKNGTVQGWAFGAGKPPAMRPPAVSRPKTTSTSHGLAPARLANVTRPRAPTRASVGMITG